MDDEGETPPASDSPARNTTPQLVASAAPNPTPPPDCATTIQAQAAAHPPFFTTLHWSPDGTTLLAPTSHQTLETYILPPDLLSPPSHPGHHILRPYHTYHFPEPTAASTIHPSFNLTAPETGLYLTAPRNLPIRLISPFTSQTVLASYPLIHERTETYTAPHTLLFNPLDHTGNTFFAGAGRMVATFDVNRDGEGPVEVSVLGRGRRRKRGVDAYLAGGGEGLAARMGNTISAMDVGLERGILAVGTFKRKSVGLVDVRGGGGGVVGLLPLPEGEGEGEGVMGVRFCTAPGKGDYLCVAERKSEVVQVFDVRKGDGVLATLRGREAMTQQRLGFDVTADGEVWAGGTDGMVRVWKDVGMLEGNVEPSSTWHGHGDAIGGIGLHPGGAGVLATCAGSRHLNDQVASEVGLEDEHGIGVENDESSDSDSSSEEEVVSISSTSSMSSSSVSERSEKPPARGGLKIWAL